MPAAIGRTQERRLREVAEDRSGCAAAVVGDLAGPVGGDYEDELVPPQPRGAGMAAGGNLQRLRIAGAAPIDADCPGRGEPQPLDQAAGGGPEILAPRRFRTEVPPRDSAMHQRRADKDHEHTVSQVATGLLPEPFHCPDAEGHLVFPRDAARAIPVC